MEYYNVNWNSGFSSGNKLFCHALSKLMKRWYIFGSSIAALLQSPWIWVNIRVETEYIGQTLIWPNIIGRRRQQLLSWPLVAIIHHIYIENKKTDTIEMNVIGAAADPIQTIFDRLRPGDLSISHQLLWRLCFNPSFHLFIRSSCRYVQMLRGMLRK